MCHQNLAFSVHEQVYCACRARGGMPILCQSVQGGIHVVRVEQRECLALCGWRCMW